MTNTTPTGTKKHRESTEPEIARRPKCFSFVFFFFRWASSNLRDFHDVFHTKQQHFSLSSAPAHRFFPGLKSYEADSNRYLKSYGFLYDASFLHVYAQII